MAIVAISGFMPVDYILNSDKDSGNPTVFKLKPLTGTEYLEVASEFSFSPEGDTKLSGKGMRLAIKYGLTGWTNFLDENDRQVKFSKGNIDKIPPVALMELTNAILEQSEAGEDLSKN